MPMPRAFVDECGYTTYEREPTEDELLEQAREYRRLNSQGDAYDYLSAAYRMACIERDQLKRSKPL